MYPILNETNKFEFYDFSRKAELIICKTSDTLSLRYTTGYGFKYQCIAVLFF
jgi:hypothetical protein